MTQLTDHPASSSPHPSLARTLLWIGAVLFSIWALFALVAAAIFVWTATWYGYSALAMFLVMGAAAALCIRALRRRRA